MSGKPKPVVVTGPWKGLEMREGHATEHHDEAAWNIDYSKGRKEARAGFETVGTGVTGHTRMHVAANDFGQAYIIFVSSRPASMDVRFNVRGLYMEQATTNYTWNLTALFGEPCEHPILCSFVDTSIIINNRPRLVTLISTKASLYFFDPMDPEAGPQRVSGSLPSAGGHAFKQWSEEVGYWQTVPHGAITCEHLGAVFYAGWFQGTSARVPFLGTDQSLVPEVAIEQSARNALPLIPSMYVWSDANDPAGVRSVSVAQAEENEAITGLHSTGEVLIIFTASSIYLRTGGLGPNTWQQHKVVSGVGCIAPRSIVEVQGIVYFLSYDGIYAFAPQAGQAVKVSAPIDPMFLPGLYPTPVQETQSHQDRMRLLGGWPPVVDHAMLPHVEGMYVPSKRQVWWGVWVRGRFEACAVTIVYDLTHQAWSLWAMRPYNAKNVCCFMSGATVRPNGEQELIYSCDGQSNLYRYGYRRDGASSGVAGTDWIGIPALWTMRYPGTTDTVVSWTRPWFKMLGVAKTPDTNPPVCVLTGEGAAQDVADSAREETAVTIQTHPRSAAGTSFWGTGTWGTMTWATLDWFTSVVDNYVSSESLRVTVIDDPNTQDRPPYLAVQSFGVMADAERQAHPT